jgi:hypothetical protein
MKRNFFFILVCVCFWMVSCKHQPFVPEFQASPQTVTVQPSCPTCVTTPICGIFDDIAVNDATSYSICNLNIANQGSYVQNASKCLEWTPNNQLDIIKSCIVACNGSQCDTTYIVILPPSPVDDTTSTGPPCDSTLVYFEKDILPILTSSCAYAGCHDAITHKDNVRLYDFAGVLKEVKPGKPDDSELYEVITTTKVKDIMPPPPSAPLPQQQIDLIKKWIEQGAKDLKCDDTGGCNTTDVKYSTFVKPLLAPCVTCHKSGNASAGILLDTYQGVKDATANGRLYGSIAWVSGFVPMPQGSAQLPDCSIQKLKSWIDAGAMNN